MDLRIRIVKGVLKKLSKEYLKNDSKTKDILDKIKSLLEKKTAIPVTSIKLYKKNGNIFLEIEQNLEVDGILKNSELYISRLTHGYYEINNRLGRMIPSDIIQELIDIANNLLK